MNITLEDLKKAKEMAHEEFMKKINDFWSQREIDIAFVRFANLEVLVDNLEKIVGERAVAV